MIKFSFDYDDLTDESIVEPEALKYYDKGIAYRKQHICNKAILCFNKAITVQPSFYNAYLQKFFTLCALEDENSKVNNEVIISIDKAINFCPTSKVSYLYSVKAEYYMRQKKYNLATRAFKDSITACPSNITVILDAINCYKRLWNVPQIIRFYELALSYIDEYSVRMTRDANGGVFREGMKLCPSSFITKQINGKPVQVCEETYPIADICFEYSQFLHSIGLHSKAYFLAGKAISNSRWSQYIDYRIDLCVEMPSKLRTTYVLNNFKADYANRKKLGGEIFENKNLYLYNCLKNLSPTKYSQNVNINIIPQLFRGEPLSILQWTIIHKQGHELSNLICNGLCNIPEITPFLDYQRYCVLEYDKRKSLFMMGMLNYYLGGIASSFIIFDDEFDMSFDSLTSKESYFYSRIAKEMGIDFIEINTFAINNLKRNIKTDEDCFFLGMLYLLDEKKKEAVECFSHSESYKFSRLMLFAIENKVEYKEEEVIFKKYKVAQSFNLEIGMDQLMDYFITYECAMFYDYYFYSNYYSNLSSEILPLWDAFTFDDNFYDKTNGIILKFRLKENIDMLLADDIVISINNSTIIADIAIDKDSFGSLTRDKILSIIRLNEMNSFDVFKNTLWLYQNNALSIDDMLSINLYAIYLQKKIFTTNLIKTALYTSCLATSYISIFIGMLFSSAFYYLDLTKHFDSAPMEYTTFSKEVTIRLSQKSDYLKILQHFVMRLSLKSK